MSDAAPGTRGGPDDGTRAAALHGVGVLPLGADGGSVLGAARVAGGVLLRVLPE